MERLVVDASALIDYLIAGSSASSFSQLLRSYDLHVPDVCDVEMLSGLRRSVLAGDLPAHAMQVLLVDYADMPLHRHRHLPFVGRAFELRDNFVPADAMYVALAERLGAGILTSDLRLARAIRRHTSVVLSGWAR